MIAAGFALIMKAVSSLGSANGIKSKVFRRI